MGKISVKDYLGNKDLLELNYIPHDEKVDICNVIIEECINVSDDYYTIDSVLLERVKKEILLSSITNIDFSIQDEVGMAGYDQLCFYNELNNLIFDCGHLYEQFDEMFRLKLIDYYNNNESLRSYMHSIKNKFLNWFYDIKKESREYLDNIDSKKVVDNIKNVISFYK